jgi:hypothetical protein
LYFDFVAGSSGLIWLFTNWAFGTVKWSEKIQVLIKKKWNK